MKTFKITMLAIVYIVLGGLLAFNLYNVVNKVFGIPLPNYAGYSFVTTSTDTGLNLKGGRLLIVHRISPDDVVLGDMLVFNYNDQIAISRVSQILEGGERVASDNSIEIVEKAFITCSDVDTAPNASVYASDVYGIVVSDYAGGNILSYLTSWQFNVVIITLFIVIVWTNIVSVHLNIIKEEEREERQNRFDQYMEQQRIKNVKK